METTVPTSVTARLSALDHQAVEMARNARLLSADIASQEEQLAKKKKALEAEMKEKQAALLREHEERLDALKQAQLEFAREKELVAPAVQIGSRVKLNVGGTSFETARTVLAMAPGFFGALFSGRHEVSTGDDGAVFIDRDPEHFRHILQWLAYGRDEHILSLPAATRLALAAEADFYALDELMMLCHGTDHTRALSEGDAALRRAENARRAAWARCDELVLAARLAEASATPLPTADEMMDDDVDGEWRLNLNLEAAFESGGRPPSRRQSRRGASRARAVAPTTAPMPPTPSTQPLSTIDLSALNAFLAALDGASDGDYEDTELGRPLVEAQSAHGATPALRTSMGSSASASGAPRTPDAAAVALPKPHNKKRPCLTTTPQTHDSRAAAPTVSSTLGYETPKEALRARLRAEERAREARTALVEGNLGWRQMLAAAPPSGRWAGCIQLSEGTDENWEKIAMRSVEAASSFEFEDSARRPLLNIVRSPLAHGYEVLFKAFAEHADQTIVSSLPLAAQSQKVLVGSLTAFEANFNRFNPDMLERLKRVKNDHQTHGWLLAGGAVLRSALRRPPPPSAWAATDVDIFIWSAKELGEKARSRHATKLAEDIWQALAVDDENWLISRGQFVINMRRVPNNHFWTENLQPPVQIVLRLYQSPSEVLHGFDIDPACLAYNGSTLWALPRAIESLKHGAILLNPLHAWPNEPTYELRLSKYAGRGFAVVVPGLQWHLVRHRLVTDNALASLKGLSRLLLLDAERAQCLHQLLTYNVQIPSLAHVFGRVHLFSGYGVGHAATRSLPTEADDAARLNNWFDTTMTIQDEATADAPNHSAWYLIVPANDLHEETFEAPRMDADERDAEWRLILDAGRSNLKIPRKLEWSTSPRTREYLNMTESHLDANYFAPAYGGLAAGRAYSRMAKTQSECVTRRLAQEGVGVEGEAEP